MLHTLFTLTFCGTDAIHDIETFLCSTVMCRVALPCAISSFASYRRVVCHFMCQVLLSNHDTWHSVWH